MHTINIDEIPTILKGATLFASGGGGQYSLGIDILNSYLNKHPDHPQTFNLVQISDMEGADIGMSLAIMGSPTNHATPDVLSEVILDAHKEGTFMCKTRLNQDIKYLISLELGGANTVVPIIDALNTGLPVIDADLCGRAVPALNTMLSALNELPTAPLAMADQYKNAYEIALKHTNDAFLAEKICLSILSQVGENGANAGVAGWNFSCDQLPDGVATETITICHKAGMAIEELESLSPEERRTHDIFDHLKDSNDIGIYVTKLTKKPCTITEFHQDQQEGQSLDQGHFILKDEKNTYKVRFLNESLIVGELVFDTVDRVLVTAPDIIAVYDITTGKAVTNADLAELNKSGELRKHEFSLGIIKVHKNWDKDIDTLSTFWRVPFNALKYTGNVKRMDW